MHPINVIEKPAIVANNRGYLPHRATQVVALGIILGTNKESKEKMVGPKRSN
jgi:hypothetical protein